MDRQNPEVLVTRPKQIVWNELFSVGVARLDEHHQVMARLINRLSDFITAPGRFEVMVEILDALADYALYHFEYEEKLMGEHGFHDLWAQHTEHREFCELIAENRYRLNLGIMDREQLHNYLTHWWSHHILQHDMEYKDFFAAQGVA